MVSNRYEEQLERINAQLLELKNALNSQVSDRASQIIMTTPKPILVEAESQKTSSQIRENPANDASYLGESSFEMHSQRASRAIERVLESSPPLGHRNDSTTMFSLRTLYTKSSAQIAVNLSNDLPLPPTQLALRALRVAEIPKGNLHFSASLMDLSRYKEVCQRVYFPLDGYTLSDFIIVNGGLFDICNETPEADLEAFGISNKEATDMAAMCESNVSAAIARMGLFMEPSLDNIQCLIAGAQIAVCRSRPQVCWLLISTSARLCLDSGLHRHKSNATDPEDARKKALFWYTYSMERGLSLNFGRAPTLSDYDISTPYPPPLSGEASIDDLITIWLDHTRVQSRMYQELYSAQGQLASQEQKTESVRKLVAELQELRRRCRALVVDRIELMDSEIMLLSNMTIAYRALPSNRPPNALQFSEECILIAREALELHVTLCGKLRNRTDNLFRTYINWNLLFCPFTPFIVILGTAILNVDHNDLKLLSQAVESLKQAWERAPGAKRLYDTCRLLLEGAKSCIEQTSSASSHSELSGQQPTSDIRESLSSEHGPRILHDEFLGGQSVTEPENWPVFQWDSGHDMSMLFDEYLTTENEMRFIDQDTRNDGA